MGTPIKMRDYVKIIDFDFSRANLLNEEERKLTYKVVRKFTQRWSGRQYVEIKIPEREDRNSYYHYVNVPIEKVIRVNTKLYKLRNKLLGEEDEV